jgi:hypothetical protein
LTSFLANLDEIPLAFVDSEITSAQAALSRLAVASILTDIQAVFASINSLPDFTQLESDISGMEGPLAQVKGYVQDLHDVNQFVGGAGQFFTTDLAHVLGNLSVSAFLPALKPFSRRSLLNPVHDLIARRRRWSLRGQQAVCRLSVV